MSFGIEKYRTGIKLFFYCALAVFLSHGDASGSTPINPDSPAIETHGMLSQVLSTTVPDPAFTWSGASDDGGSGLAGYSVYWGTSAAGLPSTTTISVAVAAYDPPAFSGTYYLRVRTFDNDGHCSGPRTIFIAKFDGTVTTVLYGAALGVSSVAWTWDSAAGATQYNFYPSTGGAAIALAGTVLTQINLSPNTPYGARVSVVNAYGEGDKTATTAVCTLAQPVTGFGLVSVEESSVAVRWEANGNPAWTQYRLDYWTAGGSTTSVQYATTTVAVFALAPSTTYYLRVNAMNSDNIPAPSTNTVVALTLPAVPSGLSGAVGGVSSITWTWNSAAGATQYNFYPSTGGAAIALAAATLIQTGLSTNTAYGARVSAVNPSGEGALTAIVTSYTLAAPPTGYGLLSVDQTSAIVRWDANENPAGTQYLLDHWTAGGSTTSVLGTATSVTVSSLAASTTYYLRVSAKNGAGSLAFSTNTVVALTRPAAPGNLTGAAGGVSAIAWAWNSVAGAAQYKFYPSTGGAAIVLAAAGLTQTGLSTNTAYGAQVSAVNSSGESAAGAVAAAYTWAAAPVSPAAAAVGVSSVSVNWDVNQNPSGTVFTAEISSDGFSSVSASSRTALSTAAFAALLPNTNYSLRVKAENGNGAAAAYTPTVSTVTLAAASSGLNLTQVSDSRLLAAWGRGLNPADTQFELSLSSDNFSANISTPLPFSSASAVIQAELTGLVMGTTWYARVRARNNPGEVTVFSSASYFIAPSLVQVVAPDIQASLSFSNAALTIPPGSFSDTAVVTMQAPGTFPADAGPAAALTGVKSGVEITADKVILPAKRLTLKLSYSAAQAAGLNEEEFVIARYEPLRAAWIAYPSTRSPAIREVTASIDHLSLFQIMHAAPAGTLSSASIKIYPNPVRPSRAQTMKFTGLPAGASVKIYTFLGELVRELSADASGMAEWDARNSGGMAAASEIYLALIKSGSETKTLKIMVER